MIVSKTINIAVLDAVQRKYWADDEGHTDSQKFIDLLSPINPAASFDVFYVTENEFPDSIDGYDGYDGILLPEALPACTMMTAG